MFYLLPSIFLSSIFCLLPSTYLLLLSCMCYLLASICCLLSSTLYLLPSVNIKIHTLSNCQHLVLFAWVSRADHEICLCFGLLPFKTHANTVSQFSNFLKTHAFCNKNQAKGENKHQIPLKPMRIAATIARRTARKRALLATPSPSVRDERLTRTHSFASPARTARTKRKRRRNEADLPVAGGRTSRTSSP